MNRFKPSITGWLIGIVFLLFLFSTFKDFFIKKAIEISSPRIIGAKITMDDFALGLVTRKIHITNFRMFNPPGYPHKIFLTMPEISVEADIPALLKGRMHFPLVVLNMDRLVIYKNKKGKMNIDSLKIVQEQMAANKGKPAKLPVFTIDLLKLNVGQVIFEDMAQTPVKVEAFDVNIRNQTIRNINGLPKLVTVVLLDAVKPTAIRGAGIYAAEAFLGIGFLPAVAITIATAQDTATADLNDSARHVYQESLKMAKELGKIKKADQDKGQISATIYGCDVAFDIQDKGWNKSRVLIKARQYLLAKYAIANGLLYQLKERLK